MVFLHQWLFLITLLFSWQTASLLAATINDYESISLLQFQNNPADNGASWHQKSLDHSQNAEILQRVGSFIKPATSVATSRGVSPSSVLLFLYSAKPNEKHTVNATPFCIDVKHSSTAHVWLISEEKMQPLVCQPLSDKNDQQVCYLKLDLSKEHQAVVMSGARLNADCTGSRLLRMSDKSPIGQVALLSCSDNHELYENPEHESGKESNGTLSVPDLSGRQPDLLLNGGGSGWDDFFDPHNRRPPWVSLNTPKLQVILPGIPSVSVFSENREHDSDLPANWSVDNQQNHVLIHFGADGIEHRLALSLDEWQLLVQRGVHHLPGVLYSIMVGILRYKDQRTQLLSQLDWYLNATEQNPSVVAGILEDLAELPPDNLFLKTSLASHLIPAYEAHLRQQAGWIPDRESRMRDQWGYFMLLNHLAGLLSIRSASETVLNEFWEAENMRLILSPLGVLTPDQAGILFSAQIRKIILSILDYLQGGVGNETATNTGQPDIHSSALQTLYPVRQAPGGHDQTTHSRTTNIQSDGSQPSTSGSGVSGSRGITQGTRGNQDDDGENWRNRNTDEQTSPGGSVAACENCGKTLTAEDIDDPEENRQTGERLCLECRNKEPVETATREAPAFNQYSQEENLDDHPIAGCSDFMNAFVRGLSQRYRRETKSRIKGVIKSAFLSDLNCVIANILAESAMKQIIRLQIPVIGNIPVRIPTRNSNVTEQDIIKWFIQGTGGRKLLDKATYEGYEEVIKNMIHAGMDINAKYKGITPLIRALKYLPRLKSTALLLMEMGADVNTFYMEESSIRISPLLLITEENDTDLLRELLQRGINQSNLLIDGKEALNNICKVGNLEAFDLLVPKVGSPENFHDNLTYISLFCPENTSELFKKIINHCGIKKFSEICDCRWTLRKACLKMDAKSLETLLEYECFKEQVNSLCCLDDESLLSYAIRNNWNEGIQILQRAGARQFKKTTRERRTGSSGIGSSGSRSSSSRSSSSGSRQGSGMPGWQIRACAAGTGFML